MDFVNTLEVDLRLVCRSFSDSWRLMIDHEKLNSLVENSWESRVVVRYLISFMNETSATLRYLKEEGNSTEIVGLIRIHSDFPIYCFSRMSRNKILQNHSYIFTFQDFNAFCVLRYISTVVSHRCSGGSLGLAKVVIFTSIRTGSDNPYF